MSAATTPSLPHWREALSREEIQALLRPNDARSWLSIASDWGLVFAAVAAVAAWPPLPTLPLVIVAALFVIGARQLGLAILMHEASHRSPFSHRPGNAGAGGWRGAH